MESQSGRSGRGLLVVLIVFIISVLVVAGTFYLSAKIYDYKIKYLENRVAELESKTNANNASLNTAALEFGQLQDFKDFWKISYADPKFTELIKTISENSDKYFTIYFFHRGECEKACKDQAFVIDYIRLKHEGKVAAIDIDINSKNTFVQRKINEFRIKNEAVVLNGEVFDGFVPAEVFEKKIANFYAQKFALVIIGEVKAEENKETVLEVLSGFVDADIPVTFGVVPKANFNFCEDSELYSKLDLPFNAEIALQSSAEKMKTDNEELLKCLARPPKTFVDFNTITPDVQIGLLNLDFENIITANDYYANKRDAFGIFHIAATTNFNENAAKVAENCALFAEETNLCVVHLSVTDFAANQTTKSAYISELVAGLSKLKSSGVHFVTAPEYKHIKEARRWI